MIINILLWLVFGGVVGWLASLIVSSDTQYSLGASIVVGILGAVAGGIIMQLFGNTGFTGFNLWSFPVSLLGAILLLVIYRAFAGRHNI